MFIRGFVCPYVLLSICNWFVSSFVRFSVHLFVFWSAASFVRLSVDSFVRVPFSVCPLIRKFVFSVFVVIRLSFSPLLRLSVSLIIYFRLPVH